MTPLRDHHASRMGSRISRLTVAKWYEVSKWMKGLDSLPYKKWLRRGASGQSVQHIVQTSDLGQSEEYFVRGIVQLGQRSMLIHHQTQRAITIIAARSCVG